MPKKNNLAQGLLRGLLYAGGSYLSGLAEKDKEDEEFQKKLQYLQQSEMIKKQADMQESMKKEARKKASELEEKSAPYNMLSDLLKYDTNPEAIGDVSIDRPVEVKGFQGVRTQPFENLSSEEYYQNLARLEKLDKIGGTEASKLYREAAKKYEYPMEYKPDIVTHIEPSTGMVTMYNKDNPTQMQSFRNPNLQSELAPEFIDDSTSPYIYRRDRRTGEMTKLGPNPKYRAPVHTTLKGRWLLRINDQTGKYSAQYLPFLPEGEGGGSGEGGNSVKHDAIYKSIDKDYTEIFGQIADYNMAKKAGLETMDAYSTKTEDFSKVLEAKRAGLQEKIKNRLGKGKRDIYDNLWVRQQGGMISQAQMPNQLWQGVVEAYRAGKLSDEDLDLYDKLFYLEYEMTPQEMLQVNQEMNAGKNKYKFIK